MSAQEPGERTAGVLQPGESQTSKVKYARMLGSYSFYRQHKYNKDCTFVQVIHEGQENKPIQTEDKGLVAKVADAVGIGSTSEKVKLHIVGFDLAL